MAKKICFKCDTEKDLSEYYAHKGMLDGHLGKCKSCTKKDTRKRDKKLISTKEGLEKERERQREKYYRLGYKEKHKPSTKEKMIIMGRYNKLYPEKYKVRCLSGHIKAKKGNQNHHWSYNEIHAKDIIELSRKDHATIHRFLDYDKSTFYYKDSNGNLLDTKKKHEKYINIILNSLDRKKTKYDNHKNVSPST